MPSEKSPVKCDVPSRTRRGSKPLVEKKRRARINKSLAELKSLVVTTDNKMGQKQSRVEKADILEITVRHLQDLRSQKLDAVSFPSPYEKFCDGYLKCMAEATRFLTAMEKVDTRVRESLRKHLLENLPRQPNETVETLKQEGEKEEEEGDEKLTEGVETEVAVKRYHQAVRSDADSSVSPSAISAIPPFTSMSPSPSTSSSTLSPITVTTTSDSPSARLQSGHSVAYSQTFVPNTPAYPRYSYGPLTIAVPYDYSHRASHCMYPYEESVQQFKHYDYQMRDDQRYNQHFLQCNNEVWRPW